MKSFIVVVNPRGGDTSYIMPGMRLTQMVTEAKLYKTQSAAMTAARAAETKWDGSADVVQYPTFTEANKVTHWSYGSGSAGCMYDNGPHFVETQLDAIEGAVFIFEDTLSEDAILAAKYDLRNHGIHYFQADIRQDAGADYVEISEHEGPCPESED